MMGSEINHTTSCRDDAFGTGFPGHGTVLYRLTGQVEPFYATLLRALTQPWRFVVSAFADQREATNTYDTASRYCCDELDQWDLAECARRAFEVERETDLLHLLESFEFDLDTLDLLACGGDVGLVSGPVDPHPIAYLYARRAAELAGVALADDEESRRVYDAAREACERIGATGRRSKGIAPSVGGWAIARMRRAFVVPPIMRIRARGSLSAICVLLVSLQVLACVQSSPRPANLAPTPSERAVQAPQTWRTGKLLIGVGSDQDSAATSSLTSITDATLTAAKSLVVLDAAQSTLSMYDSIGNRVWVVGSKGPLPGQFQYPTEIVAGGNGTFTVVEGGGLRLHRFGADGSFVAAARLDRSRFATLRDSLFSPHGVTYLSDGSLLVTMVERTRETYPDSTFRVYQRLMRVNVDISEVDTIGEFPDKDLFDIGSADRPFLLPAPFTSALVTATGGYPPRIYVGDAKTGTIWSFMLAGTLASVFVPEMDWIPITKEDKASWLSAADHYWRPRAPNPTRYEQFLRNVAFPDHRPGFRSLHVDSRGNLWITTNAVRDQQRRVVIFAHDRLVANLSMRDGEAILEVGDDYIVVRGRGDSGAEYVHVYQLIKGEA